jgi:hypothetical protein
MTRPLRLQPDHVKNAPARDVLALITVRLSPDGPEENAHLLSCFHVVPGLLIETIPPPKKRRCSACAVLHVPIRTRRWRRMPEELRVPEALQFDEDPVAALREAGAL